MTFKVQKTENTGIVYADPTDPGLTLRVKHSSAPKSVKGVQVQNQVTEIIVNDDVDIPLTGDETGVDAVSVRIRVSGSLQATARKEKLLKAVNDTLERWATEDVLKGFNPQTVPDSPAA